MSVKNYENAVKKLFEKNEDINNNEVLEQFKEIEEKYKLKDKSTAWDKVLLARDSNRPKTLDYINSLFDNFIELFGDRLYANDYSIVGGIATFNGLPVTIIGQQKGCNLEENLKRNFGMPKPEGYRKALRLMKQAEKFGRPIICLVDTPGAYPGVGAEERGQGEAIARNLAEMSDLSVPVISFVIGEGGSGGALGLAVANQVCMLENSIYSILSPEGYATILYKDSTKTKEVAEKMKLTAKELKELELIDCIVKEPYGGAGEYPFYTMNEMKKTILKFLTEYAKKSPNEIKTHRYKKYRTHGFFDRIVVKRNA